MFNVCLIQPPIDDFYATPIRNIPLGLLSIGASLKAKHNISLIDLRYPKPHKTPVPEELADASAYYRSEDASPFSLYKSYSRFGTHSKDIAKLIPGDIDVFLVSALFSTYINEALEVITLIRQKKERASIIAGGSGAMFHADEFFNAGTDFISFPEIIIMIGCEVCGIVLNPMFFPGQRHYLLEFLRRKGNNQKLVSKILEAFKSGGPKPLHHCHYLKIC
ncbi:cobalamin B12-binding domain-containing protein [bacterium]|nr:cobalamin B12-binding domain-containing protein [bacterium]MBU1634254.1 cobalamin B12-binding domain-containing protein [bacterium]